MKLPRDLSGPDLARLLGRYRYTITRQSGSHLRLTCISKGTEHHIPAHSSLKVGTLNGILRDVAAYLEMDRNRLAEEIFGR